jgi:hypothetical protein
MVCLACWVRFELMMRTLSWKSEEMWNLNPSAASAASAMIVGVVL